MIRKERTRWESTRRVGRYALAAVAIVFCACLGYPNMPNDHKSMITSRHESFQLEKLGISFYFRLCDLHLQPE